MIALLQRVAEACVRIDGQSVGAIGRGLLVLVCAERGDTEALGQRLLDKLLRYRVFADDRGRMNRSLLELRGDADNGPDGAGLLLVPQFTLAADTRSGLRPSFTPAAEPAVGRALFEHLVQEAARQVPDVQTGRFGADMQVALVNDGPVTFWLQTGN
ncbi:MAG: D-aminoacyl-tRNA deacylase [Burkholderiaceae bacterium]